MIGKLGLHIGLIAVCFIGFSQSQDASIRINENPLTKNYRIYYGNTETHNVKVSLLGNGNTELFSENFPNATSFVKNYSLSTLNAGKYTWQIQYGRKRYGHEFEILSEKKLLKEAITAEVDDLLNLIVSVKSYNIIPVNIFFYKADGEQIEYIFWEPTLDELSTTIHLSDYDAYEIRVELLQQGEPVFDETFNTY